MITKFCTWLLLFSLTIGFSFSQLAFARTALEECNLHKQSELPGTCDVRGANCECAHFIDNLGQEGCKLCGDGGCQIAGCENCAENDTCEQSQE